MGVEIPVHVYQPDVFLNHAAHRALGEATAGVVEEHSGSMRGSTSIGARASNLQEQFFSQWPIFIQGFLGFVAVGDDALFVAFAPDAEDLFALIDVDEI